MSQPKFFKAKGTTNGWSPYCALVEAADVTAGGESGDAKDFNVLDVDFNKAVKVGEGDNHWYSGKYELTTDVKLKKKQ
jgi:hypothetical protein